MYVKDTLKCNEIVWSDDIYLECVGVEITLSKEMTFVVICMYRKPSAKIDFYSDLKTLINLTNLKKELILMGDFNINWDNKKDRKNLKHITDYFNLEQLIKTPTRITNRSKTTIDLIFTNKPIL